jgi:type IV pilus assembly protein PilX
MTTVRIKLAECQAGTKNDQGIGTTGVPAHQRGVALIMSLVILLILTILGITAMRTSSLQEKMSANIQESTRVFEIAESGLQKSLGTAGAFDLDTPTSNNYPYNGGTTTVATQYLQMSPPKRGSGFSSVDYDGANFDQTSTATGLAGARAIIHRGVVQIVGKSK